MMMNYTNKDWTFDVKNAIIKKWNRKNNLTHHIAIT